MWIWEILIWYLESRTTNGGAKEAAFGCLEIEKPAIIRVASVPYDPQLLQDIGYNGRAGPFTLSENKLSWSL